jgi:hypothetical protein
MALYRKEVIAYPKAVDLERNGCVWNHENAWLFAVESVTSVYFNLPSLSL